MVFIGDVHGNLGPFSEILSNLHNEHIIQVGDFGVGFGVMNEFSTYNIIKKMEKLNDVLVENNNKLYVIRGNHDNPVYWESKKIKMSNIIFVPDYKKIEIGGKTVLFVGGGISIDRIIRTENYNWWCDEEIAKVPRKNLDCDILVTHVPSRKYFSKIPSDTLFNQCVSKDDNLINDIKKEDEILDKLFKLAKCKWWISGHYHWSDRNYTNDCNFINLNCYELFEIR